MRKIKNKIKPINIYKSKIKNKKLYSVYEIYYLLNNKYTK